MRTSFLSSIILAPAALALSLSALTTGCKVDGGKQVVMEDSLSLQIFGLQDDLHTPYVAGAHFSISVATASSETASSWALESSDPTIISVAPQQAGATSFEVTTVGVGEATLTVKDGTGHVVDQHDVEVARPDHVQLCSHGLLLAGFSDDQAQVTAASMVESGTATFLVRYFQGSQELYGNGAVQPAGSGTVTAQTASSSFGDDRDWVEIVSGASDGSGQVSLVVDGATTAVIPVTVVPTNAVASVGALAQSDANASDGQTLYVFARAFDSQSTDLYGASFSWALDGSALSAGLGSSGPSDALAYTFKQGASESVSLGHDGLSAAVTVQGTGGTVESTENVGCSVARGAVPATQGVAAWALVAAAAGTLASRRRRSSRG